MPDDNMTTNQPISTVPPVDPAAPPADTFAVPTPVANPAAVAAPAAPSADFSSPSVVVPGPLPEPSIPITTPDIYTEVASKISESRNVLIALSSDPSVDEMAAAIGLSLYLDKLGKRATAIYSGATPNALEFLKPEETFEPSADTLQDFVIALSKDKADHLRYKLDGDYVKVYITPYRTKITEDDLDFSYGDYNVDLVLALDVANGVDLDSALREHGRIMHDAVIINITTGNPGKFGEIEWSDKKASSVSEMIAKLLYSVKSEVEVSKEEATAFLTGIVAATNRFSNASTTPETMTLASRLMKSGANQQLISKNITPDVDNQLYSVLSVNSPATDTGNDPTKLNIQHGTEKEADSSNTVETTVTEKESTLLDDLKAAEASLAQAGAETTPDLTNQPVRIDGTSTSTSEQSSVIEPASEPISIPEPVSEPALEPSLEPAPESTSEPAPESSPELPPVVPAPSELSESPEPALESDLSSTEEHPSDKGEKVITPPADMDLSATDGNSDKYGKMLEDALAGIGATSTEAATISSAPEPTTQDTNPAAATAPAVASSPEINGVPEMNYMPLPGDEVLPPPPTPPLDMNAPIAPSTAPSPEPAASEPSPSAPAQPSPSSLGPQPAMQDQVYTPQASDPSAFKIPGM